MKKRMQVITANVSGPVRHDTMEGRDYLVAPMVMLTEGVHEGSNGPLLYTKEELGKTPGVWNYKPVVVYHPKRNGVAIAAASDPETLTNHKVGVIMNTKAGTVKVKEKDVPALRAEAWLESDRMDAVDSRVSDAIENNKMMELSTGLYTNNEDAEEGAEWNGEAYDAIARDFKPDHLALLPDLKGACSIEDGAGLLQLNELSHGDIRSLLNSALRVGKENAWIEDVFDGYFVYEDSGSFYKQNYSDADNDVEILGTPVEVFKVIEYRTAGGVVVSNVKGKAMKKRKIVEALIANKATQFGDDDEDALIELPKEVLEKMTPVVNEESPETPAETPAETPEETPAEETPAEETPAAPVENKENKEPKTVEQYISEAPAEIQCMLQNGLNSYQNDKARLIKAITANKRNKFTAEQLQAKDVGELQAIAALASSAEPVAPLPLGRNYSGQAEVVDNTEDEEEPMETPTLNYEKEKEKKKTG